MTARLYSPFGSTLTLSAFYLPSPHLHRSIPHHVLLFARFQVLPSHPDSTGNAEEKFGRNFQPCSHAFSFLEMFFFKVWNGNKQATIKLKRNSNLHFSTLLLIKVRDAHILTRCHSFLVSQLEGVLCHCQ